MAKIITMPRLSDTMTEGVVAKWLKKVGDKINEGDILAEIETDKATMEFESFNSGTLLHIGIQEGQSAPVDSLLAIIGKEGEDITPMLHLGRSTNKAEESTSDETKSSEAKSDSQKTEVKTESVPTENKTDTASTEDKKTVRRRQSNNQQPTTINYLTT